MKPSNKFFAFTIICCMAVGSASCSCGNPKRAIKEAAYNYLYAMANYKIDDAVPYCTKETQEGVLETGRNLMKAVEPGYIESDTPAKIQITDIKVVNDSMAVVSYRKTTPLKKQVGDVDVIKRDGQWKVHIELFWQKRARLQGSNAADSTSNQKPQAVQSEINGVPVLGFPSAPSNPQKMNN